MGGGESKVAVIAALVANLIIAIMKLIGGLISGSAAMLAESAHSFSDVGNQILLLVGIRRASRPPSARHPYGTGKDAYFWPFMVAILLFGVAGAYSLFEGVNKTLHPHPLQDIRLSLGILAVSFAIEVVSLYIAFRQAKKSANANGIRTVREFLSENRDATLLTVLVEDGLALAGLPIAAVAILLSHYTGNGIYDGVGSILIGLMLMGFAVFLAREVHVLLVGTGLSKRDLARVQGVMAKEKAIERVISVQSMYLGPHSVLLGAEVDLQNTLAGAEVERLLERVKSDLVREIPDLKFVYLVPTHGVAGQPGPAGATERHA